MKKPTPMQEGLLRKHGYDPNHFEYDPKEGKLIGIGKHQGISFRWPKEGDKAFVKEETKPQTRTRPTPPDEDDFLGWSKIMAKVVEAIEPLSPEGFHVTLVFYDKERTWVGSSKPCARCVFNSLQRALSRGFSPPDHDPILPSVEDVERLLTLAFSPSPSGSKN